MAGCCALHAHRPARPSLAGLRLITQTLSHLDIKPGLRNLANHRGQQAVLAGQRDAIVARTVDQRLRQIGGVFSIGRGLWLPSTRASCECIRSRTPKDREYLRQAEPQ